MKKCPYCAEEILDEAIVCKHCGREIDPERIVQVQQSRASSSPQVVTGAPSPPPLESQPKESSRTGSLILGSILIGVAIAALAAIPRMLNVLEAMQVAANDPSAISLMRMLEQDLAFHFITNLVIYSLIGGLVIWGWRRNRNRTLAILGVALIALVLLTAWQTGVIEQASSVDNSIGAINPTRQPVPRATQSPTDNPSGISAGASNFFDDSTESSSPAEVFEKDRQDFLEFDLQVSEWMGEISSILERQARSVIHPRTAANELNELQGSMRLLDEVRATGKLPLLIQIFEAVVERLITAMVWPFTNPPGGVSASRLADALEYFDYAIEQYADYGSSLGFDTWSTVCASAPDHPRCN